MIKAVITDLDNTLYDWVGFYIPAFNAMVDELVELTGVDEVDLRRSFKRVHQKHGTAEYAFAIQELDVLPTASSVDVLKKYQTAIRAFRSVRKRELKLYEGVDQTLRQLRSQGKIVVAFTDAMMFYAVARVKQLEIEDHLDGLVALRDHGLPEGTRPEDVRLLKAEHYKTIIPFVDELDPQVVKPNSEALDKILRDLRIESHEAVYVGDSLHRDVFMAQRCGVHDVHAVYGTEHDPLLYKQLVEITHWTQEDVERETQLRKIDVEPSHRISRFAELVDVVSGIDEAGGKPSRQASGTEGQRAQRIETE